ncbi:MAG: RecBCD enzyme subunit RecC [Chlamydiae bacterium]|nr:RecBCD enzyme subunit RecC [Chlamydiota bacterium]
MTKGQIHLSNDLEKLIPHLKENLYPPGSGPFEKRLVIVPHLGLKAYIMQSLGRDSDLQVAAGFQVMSLSQGWAKITKKKVPSSLELSLFLQHELIPLIDQFPELSRYFHQEAKERRIGPFCHALAKYFLRYAIFGKNPLPKWQEILWKKWNWSEPTLEQTDWKIHLFGFSFLPKFYFSHFAKLGAQMYLFSPCKFFWGDFYSEKERELLRKNVPERQLDFFDESFADQNSFLSSWGKVGRKTLLMIEESDVPTQEYYREQEGESCLQKLQKDLLFGSFSSHQIDETLSFASATSVLREVEVLKDHILHLCITKGLTPKEIQVFAPDISHYVPYIHATFSDMAYAISDIPRREEDPTVQAFSKMLDLPKKRFALDEVLQVLAKLSRFSIDISLVRKWMERAHVRWGFSKEQKRVFYLKDFLEDQIHANGAEGTWEQGLKGLLHGLGHSDGIQGVGFTEITEFDQLYRLLFSLVDDLAPLYDGSRWTIPTWLRYFACLLESYFAIDPSYDLYKELTELAAACDHLDREKVSYEGIEKVLESILSKKCKSHQAPHLQAIRFGSLSEGCVQPSKAICLIGMQEDAFPKREEKDSLYLGEKDFRPTLAEQDRYLFLQALSFAREFFSISYLREKGATLVALELFSALEGGEIVHHPSRGYDSTYFGGEHVSYNESAYQVAKAKQNPQPKPPLIPEFFVLSSFDVPKLAPMDIDVRKLFKFARHPLRYYLHEVLGVYPDFGKNDQREYLLDPLTKYQLVREALQSPLSEVLKKADLPVHLLQPLAKSQIQKEVEEWHLAMDAFGILPKDLETKKIDVEIGPVHLFGKLELFTPKGMLAFGKNQLEDQIRFWPQALLMEHLGLSLLFVKDHTTFTPTSNLEEYLAYFQMAEKHPSPLVPSLAKPLLQGGDLQKALKQVEDEVFTYLYFCDPMPNASIIQKNWNSILQKLFGRAFAAV